MQKYQNNVQTLDGRAIVGASVTVTEFPGGAPATVYNSNGSGVITQPILTNGDGEFAFYAANGRYQLSVTGGGISVAQTITDIVLFDPDDAAIAVTPRDFGAPIDGVSDAYPAIQAALDFLNSIGGGTLQCSPVATYLCSQQIRLYSNITLDLYGSTLVRNYNSSPTGVGLVGVQTGAEKILVRNGSLNCNGSVFEQSASCISGISSEEITFDNVRFLNVPDFHGIDFSDTKRLSVRNCKFLGFANKSGTRAFSEAIQVDPGASGSPSNSDWVIDGCYFGPNPDNSDPDFGSWGAGVGNHASIDNSTVSRISIVNNTFDGCGFAGVRPFAWDNANISGNSFINCALGVYVNMYNGSVPRANTDICISHNSFSGTTGANIVFVDDDSAGVTPSTGITVSGNIFRGSASAVAVRLQAVTDATIDGNSAKNCLALINLDTCNAVSVNGNIGDGFTSTAIFVGTGAGSDITVTGNTIRNIVGARAVHINAAYNGVVVSDNTFSDISGVSAVSADSACSNIAIKHNTVKSGPLALVPSTNAIITSASVINVEVIDNLIGAGVPQPSVQSTAGTGVFSGSVTNTPEAAITAPVGSTARRKNGGAATTFYVKESGTGNTGWVGK